MPEMVLALLWIPATIAAAAAQTARNIMQKRLTESIGTLGATQVRFLYGFPFALIFLTLILAASGDPLPRPDRDFLSFTTLGALTQIGATALMLAAMREKSFSIVTAYTKTEPVQIALFGLLVLGDPLTIGSAAAILIATMGVILTSLKPGRERSSNAKPMLFGIAAGACFAMAAIGFRGAILGLPSGSFLTKASTTLVWSLFIQTLVLLAYCLVFDRPALTGSFKIWRSSLLAGFMGALASQFWFIGFSLTSAANVRTLGLLEVIFAQFVAWRFMRQTIDRRETIGLSLIVLGVGLLLGSAGHPL